MKAKNFAFSSGSISAASLEPTACLTSLGYIKAACSNLLSSFLCQMDEKFNKGEIKRNNLHKDHSRTTVLLHHDTNSSVYCRILHKFKILWDGNKMRLVDIPTISTNHRRAATLSDSIQSAMRALFYPMTFFPFLRSKQPVRKIRENEKRKTYFGSSST